MKVRINILTKFVSNLCQNFSVINIKLIQKEFTVDNYFLLSTVNSF